MKKVKDLLYAAMFVAIIGVVIGLPIYARISTCGWMSLFVECRITSSTK